MDIIGCKAKSLHSNYLVESVGSSFKTKAMSDFVGERVQKLLGGGKKKLFRRY